jgi:hypothetical protein
MLNNPIPASGDALVLQCKENSNFKPHPPGIYQALCVDVIELGLLWSEYQGRRKLQRKLKLVFETEYVGEDGKRGIVTSKNFTASMHPKAHLAEFLSKWRGRPVVPNENVDLKKLPGASCTLVLSHQRSLQGHTYACIDAVSKAAKKVQPSGTYDGAALRQRLAEWMAKEQAKAATPANAAAPGPSPAPTAGNSQEHRTGKVAAPLATSAPADRNVGPTPAPAPAPAPTAEYDDVPF